MIRVIGEESSGIACNSRAHCACLQEQGAMPTDSALSGEMIVEISSGS